jgi:thiol-disulfide isomerase/thioredoxin
MLGGLFAGGSMRGQSVPTAPSAEQQKAERQYAEMLSRVQHGDMSVDFRAFRVAGALRVGPHSSAEETAERTAFRNLSAAGDWTDALDSAKRALERNYASPIAHYDAMIACQELHQADEAATHEKILNALLDSIQQSGDGKSAATAYFVVTVQEEYIFLNRVLHLRGRSQSWVRKDGHLYDRLLLVDPATSQTQDLWFNSDFDSSDPVAELSAKDGVLATMPAMRPNATPESTRQEALSEPVQATQRNDLLDTTSIVLAGPKAVDCGRVPLHSDPKLANDCALNAFSHKTPFRVRYDPQGAGSGGAISLVGTPKGNLYEIHSDSDSAPVGAAKVQPLLCPQPAVLVPSGDRLTCFAHGPSQAEDQTDLLIQATLVYRGASNLQLKGVKIYERHDEFIDTVTRTPFTLILMPDNKFRQELKNVAGADLQVCDGQRHWNYFAPTKKYTSGAGTPDPIYLFNSRVDLRFLTEHLLSAELLRQETLQAGAEEHLCDVVQAHYERGPQPRNTEFGDVLFWIDHNSHLVWKTRMAVTTEVGQSGAKTTSLETTLYTDVQMSVSLPADTFAFAPPPGAAELNAGRVVGRETLLGRPAADFNLRNLDGEEIHLSALKGRVVLLDFWATWCGPCRVTMPRLNSLFKKFRKQDVVILGIDMNENEQTVRAFVRKNRFEYPILLVPKGDPVVENYSARAIPTLVLIDKNGVVADYKVGYGNETEEMLRADLVRLLSADYVPPRPAAAATGAQADNGLVPKTADALLSRGNENALKGAAALVDELANASVGDPRGISWTNAMGNRGAVFSAANASRIEYPGRIPREGTLELWINVASGYYYDNYAFRRNLDRAMIFSTDAQGGDVTWPGTTKLFVSRNGDVSLVVAANKYDNPPSAPLEAKGTPFRFGEWHAVGFSIGSLGQYIMVDGKVVAAAPTRTQEMGCAGTHRAPVDIPTVGETASHFWPRHRYEGGFEGIVARFRASATQRDWNLARGIGD